MRGVGGKRKKSEEREEDEGRSRMREPTPCELVMKNHNDNY